MRPRARKQAVTKTTTNCCSMPGCPGLCQVVLSCLLLTCSCYISYQTIQLDTTCDNSAKPKLWPRIGQDSPLDCRSPQGRTNPPQDPQGLLESAPGTPLLYPQRPVAGGQRMVGPYPAPGPEKELCPGHDQCRSGGHQGARHLPGHRG